MLLYPRLSPQQGKQLAEERSALSLLELEQLAGTSFPSVTYAPTGGARVTESQLEDLQRAIKQTARDHGYVPGLAGGEPLPLAADQKASFDAALARTIHQKMRVSPSEACRPGVWRFVGTVLSPEHIRWRFPGESTTHERFLGNRLRNMYGRVWWRAHLLRDEQSEDPYWLVSELGEDELVQITERPNAAGFQPLAAGIARGLISRWHEDLGVSRSGLLREVMKRLLRLLPLVRFESLTLEEVAGEVDALFDETLRGLGIEVSVKEEASATPWNKEAQWQDLALYRRARFLKGLDDEDLARLASLEDITLPNWGEFRPRWKYLFRISGTAGQVLELAPQSKGLPRDDSLGNWLTQQPAGSWQKTVDPTRARRLLGALRSNDLQAVYAAIGWDWPEDVTQSGSQRYLRRRYSGSWEALLLALPHDALDHLGRFLRLWDPDDGEGDEHARLTLARWLLVKPELEWGDGYEEEADSTEEVLRSGTADPDMPAPEAQPIPEPPVVIKNTLDVLEVNTVADLRSLDLGEVAALRGVGRKKVEAIREFRESLPAAPPQAEPVHALDREQQMPEPPGLITNLLRSLEVRTIGELVDLDLVEVGGMQGVGRKKVRAIQDFRKEVLHSVRLSGPTASTRPLAESLEELVGWMMDALNERERMTFSMRFQQGATLAEVGDALDVSRERARQILNEGLRRLRVRYAGEARELLEAASPGLGGLAYEVPSLGVEPWQGLLAASVAHDSSWIHAEPLLWAGTSSSLDAMESKISGLVQESRIGPAWLSGLASQLDLTKALVHLLLTGRLGWVENAGVLELPAIEMDRGEWLLMLLRSAGPTHQSTIAKWLMDREGLSPEQQAAEADGYVRKAEGTLSRLDDAWRWGRGTFIHTADIPVPQADLRAMVAWCTERVAGRTGPYGVQNLLQELGEAGFDVSGLNKYILKDVLTREEAIIPLRKGNVACANAYDEHGIDLANRVLEALRQGDRPMSFGDILEALPSDIAYSEVAIRQRLYDTPGIKKVDRGLFVADATRES